MEMHGFYLDYLLFPLSYQYLDLIGSCTIIYLEKFILYYLLFKIQGFSDTKMSDLVFSATNTFLSAVIIIGTYFQIGSIFSVVHWVFCANIGQIIISYGRLKILILKFKIERIFNYLFLFF